jgi:hypothetical protein
LVSAGISIVPVVGMKNSSQRMQLVATTNDLNVALGVKRDHSIDYRNFFNQFETKVYPGNMEFIYSR